jgi:aminobenzoyl-glutamate transport protein
MVSLMLPYSVALMILWTIWLLIYWAIGLPLGLQASYVY